MAMYSTGSLHMLKVTPHKDASWPEAVENVQMFPDTYIMCVYVFITCTLCAVVFC